MTRGEAHRYRNEWILLGIALLCLAAFIGYSLNQERVQIEARERDRLQVQAQVIDENLGRQLEGVNNALVRVRDDIPSWNSKTIGQSGSHVLVALRGAMPGVRAMGIFDADGTALASTRQELIGRTLIKDRAFFNVPRERPDPNVLYVSPPFKSVLGVYSINVVRSVVGSRGEFAGIVAATLEPAYFEVVLRSVLYATDMRTALVHGDGTAFLFMPEYERGIGSNVAVPGSFFTRHRDSGQAASVLTGHAFLAGEERMMATRTVRPARLHMDNPLIIHVSRDVSAIYRSWRRSVVGLGGTYGLFALAAILSLYFAQRRRRTFDRAAARHQAEQQESAERLKLATETAGMGVFEYDRVSGRMTWDDAMLALHGIDPAAFTSRYEDWRNSVLAEDRPAAEAALQAPGEEGGQFSVQYRVKRGDGQVRMIRTLAQARRSPAGPAAKLVGVSEDITERMRYEDQLRRLNEELERRVEERTHALQVANRELEAFSYSVSHDLRAPLRAISGFTQMIEDGYAAQFDEPGRALLARVRAGAQRMGDLIDDLLKLSQISRQKLTIGPVDLSALAREAAEELGAADPGRRIEWVIAPGVMSKGDPGLLRVALRNLIGNAWKYSSRREEARIEFGVTGEQGRTEYFVRDNGAGFDMVYAGKLFGAFQRLHSPSEFPGTGVGLATVARVVHRHGGDVRAEARVGEGASFFFTL